jgi:putative membrane protein
MAVCGASNLSAEDHKDHEKKGLTSVSADQKSDKKDVSFIKEAIKGGKKEVAMGRMAAEKAQNAQVKQLGQRLQQDHTKANQELMQIAQKQGVSLEDKDDKAHKDAVAHVDKDDHMAKFEGKTGAEFDKAFIEHTLMHHQKGITKYQQALQDCEDTEVKAYIQKTLPALRQHLEMARTAGRAVGVDQQTLSAADQFLSDRNNAGSIGLGTAPSSERGTGTSSSPSTTPPLDSDREQ